MYLEKFLEMGGFSIMKRTRIITCALLLAHFLITITPFQGWAMCTPFYQGKRCRRRQNQSREHKNGDVNQKSHPSPTPSSLPNPEAIARQSALKSGKCRTNSHALRFEESLKNGGIDTYGPSCKAGAELSVGTWASSEGINVSSEIEAFSWGT